MHCTCVRQSDLPNTTRLFADVLYHPDRTARFYQHPLRGAESFQAAARQIEFSAERRAALIDALRVQNPESPALQRLAQPGTVAVVTGQQVGLFSGPCYTIYKVLHAVKLAAELSANGLPAVPVFWLALRRSGNEYFHNSRRFTSQELIARAASLSPNAILRPVIQDSMLPTVSYIGGPAETAYLAQSEALYLSLIHISEPTRQAEL